MTTSTSAPRRAPCGVMEPSAGLAARAVAPSARTNKQTSVKFQPISDSRDKSLETDMDTSGMNSAKNGQGRQGLAAGKEAFATPHIGLRRRRYIWAGDLCTAHGIALPADSVRFP